MIQMDDSALSQVGLSGAVSDYFPALIPKSLRVGHVADSDFELSVYRFRRCLLRFFDRPRSYPHPTGLNIGHRPLLSDDLGND